MKNKVMKRGDEDMTFPKLVTNDTIAVFIDGAIKTVLRTAPNAEAVLRILEDPNATKENILAAFDVKKVVASLTHGNLVLNGDVLEYSGVTFSGKLVTQVRNLLTTGGSIAALANFIGRLAKNPSKRAIDELYPFLEKLGLTITPNGTFLAYKAVRNDYTDKHTGKFYNYPGAELKMLRGAVCDDADVACSSGFHAGTLEYVKGFASGYGDEGGDRIVIVEIDPADVVSIPKDCSCQKLRTARYMVVGEFRGVLPRSVVAAAAPYVPLESGTQFADEDDEPVYTVDEYIDAIAEAREEGRQAALEDIRNRLDKMD